MLVFLTIKLLDFVRLRVIFSFCIVRKRCEYPTKRQCTLPVLFESSVLASCWSRPRNSDRACSLVEAVMGADVSNFLELLDELVELFAYVMWRFSRLDLPLNG